MKAGASRLSWKVQAAHPIQGMPMACRAQEFHTRASLQRSHASSWCPDDSLFERHQNRRSSHPRYVLWWPSGTGAGCSGVQTKSNIPAFRQFWILQQTGWKNSTKVAGIYHSSEFYPSIDSTSKSSGLDFFRGDLLQDYCINHRMATSRFRAWVMNTDNMSAIGLTIDYGPYGWIDNYDEDWTPNTTMPNLSLPIWPTGYVALWNLYQLANALHTIIGHADLLRDILDEAENWFIGYYSMMIKSSALEIWTRKVLTWWTEEKVVTTTWNRYDYIFRKLSTLDISAFNRIKQELLAGWVKRSIHLLIIIGAVLTDWEKWFVDYIARLKRENIPVHQRHLDMKSVNPKYVLRNYMAQMAIDAAYKGIILVDELYEMLRKPYRPTGIWQMVCQKAWDWARTKAGCSMPSCSSLKSGRELIRRMKLSGWLKFNLVKISLAMGFCWGKMCCGARERVWRGQTRSR